MLKRETSEGRDKNATLYGELCVWEKLQDYGHKNEKRIH